MGVLANIVPQAQPALRRVPAAATAGATWRWVITVTNDAAPVDLTGCTATCQIVGPNNDTVLALTVALGNGTITISADEATTAELAPSGPPLARRWFLRINDGTDTVQFWGVEGSPFVIYPAA